MSRRLSQLESKIARTVRHAQWCVILAKPRAALEMQWFPISKCSVSASLLQIRQLANIIRAYYVAEVNLCAPAYWALSVRWEYYNLQVARSGQAVECTSNYHYRIDSSNHKEWVHYNTTLIAWYTIMMKSVGVEGPKHGTSIKLTETNKCLFR